MQLKIKTTDKEVESANYILNIAVDLLLESKAKRKTYNLTLAQVNAAKLFRSHLIDSFLK